jgi:peptidyl-prolyl cis-trans isomerase A (cyclophilin A)
MIVLTNNYYYYAITFTMQALTMLKKLLCTPFLLVGLTSPVNATIVEFQTSLGAIQVNLFDQTTPETVANFLQYIDEHHYTNSVIHRVSSNFVVQGGGYSFEGDWPLTRIETNPTVTNEPVYSNVKGTIAMAKLSNQPDSATDQWFFNLTDNASNLDVQNGGFTVFGQVIGDGMTVVEKIANLALCQDVPMTDYSTQNCIDQSTPGIENFIVINQIDIVDSSKVTDADITPVKNTLNTPDDENSSGGSFTWFTLLGLFSISIRKLIIK